MFKKTWIACAAAAAMMTMSGATWAVGGASGPKVTFPTTGKLGTPIRSRP